jgi:hypothetical protein
MKQQHKFNWHSLVGLLAGLVLGLAGYNGHSSGIVSPVAAAGPDYSLIYAGDLPIAADAQTFSYNVASRQLDYTSPSTVETLATFYRRTLLAQGWQEIRYLSTYGNGLALVRFKQGESSLSVHISNSGSTAATEVSIRTHCVVWPEEGMNAVIYAEDLPIAADAQALSYNAAFKQIDYTSPSAVETLATFYRQALLAQGWQEIRYLSTSGNGLALVRFKQGESSLSVHISNSDSTAATEVTMLTHCVMWPESSDSAFYAANPELMLAHRHPTTETLTLEAFLEANPELRFARNRLTMATEDPDSASLAANPELMAAHRFIASNILTLEAFLEANPELRFARNRLAMATEDLDSASLAANPELMVAHRLAGVMDESQDSAFLAANPELMAAHRYAALEALTLKAFLEAKPE